MISPVIYDTKSRLIDEGETLRARALVATRLVKSDITLPVFYGAIVALLLAYRAATKPTGILRAKSSAKSLLPLPAKEIG